MTSTGAAKQPFHQLNTPTKKRITTIRPGVVIGSIVGVVLVLLVGIWLSFGEKPKDKEAPPVPPSSATIATMASKTLADFPAEPAPSIPATAEARRGPYPRSPVRTTTPGQGRNTGSPPAAPGAPAGYPRLGAASGRTRARPGRRDRRQETAPPSPGRQREAEALALPREQCGDR